MKKLIWIAAFVSFAGCKDNSGLTGDDVPEPDAPPSIDAPPGITLVDVPAGDITTDTVWTRTNIYTLKGYVFVTGGTLTIEAGTTIRGDSGSALTITKDGRLHAVGNAAAPIVFTSSSPTPRSGDWGGLVMLGRATINVAGGANGIEGFAASFGERIRYGGTDNAHDCGSLKYARIEYAGFELATAIELNGLTIGGCGSGTEIDFVQSHLGLDDGVEVFGGTVDLRHILITQPDDDGLDFDLGWVGTAQFVIVQQKQDRGDKGFEADNHPSVFSSQPRTQPVIWNATVIGGDGLVATKKQGGMHLRRGVGGHINNAVIAYFNGWAIDIDGADSRNVFNTELSVNSVYFQKGTSSAALWPTNFDVSSGNQNDCDPSPAPPNTNCFDEVNSILTLDTSNQEVADVMLTDPKNLTAPNFKPLASSPVLLGCGVPPFGFDQAATYCGAIGTTDWTAGWTAYPL